MRKNKCITFDKESQDNLSEHIKAKMKANQEDALKQKASVEFCTCGHFGIERVKYCSKCGKQVNLK
jgi:hypothetical protein